MRIEAQQLREVIAHADKPDVPISPTYRRTAVFALLVNREQTNLLLIRRADRGDPWANHIALPGGHIAPTDADALATAYRETSEEVGIEPDAITYLGDLGHFQTGNRPVDLQVFVGLWNAAGPLRVDRTEVAQVIEVSLGWLVREHQRRGFASLSGGQLGDALVYPLADAADTTIWGVTARIIHHLLGLISTMTPLGAGDLT
ncbi:MAG: NUDIX hydrolase [Planctomycetota bacterium]